MKQIIIPVITIVIFLCACNNGETKAKSENTTAESAGIENSAITDKHYQFLRTGVYIIPPPGFVPTADSSSLLNEKNGSTIMYVEDMSSNDNEVMLLGKDNINQ